MSSLAFQYRRHRSAIWETFWTCMVVAGIAAGVWQIVAAIERWHNGIYAGFHYGDALYSSVDALSATYGRDKAMAMQQGKPNVINTHYTDAFGNHQIRIFQFVGPRGVKYCVGIWHPHYVRVREIDVGGSFFVKKNCVAKDLKPNLPGGIK